MTTSSAMPTGVHMQHAPTVLTPSAMWPLMQDPEAKKKHDENVQYFMFYMGFLMAVGIVYQTFDDVGLSTFLTLSVGIQFFALVCLLYQVKCQVGVRGVSKGSLVMQCFVYGFRLSSSTWLKGYIPTDGTGDYLYQILDFVTLLLAVFLIFCCTKKYASSYQEQYDTLEVKPLIMACSALAVLLHPDLNDRPLFDTLWTASLYIDSLAMLPQLWMMSRSGEAKVLTSHYVAAMALSRLMNFVFWFHAYPELAMLGEEDEEGNIGEPGSNVAGYAVVVAHVVQLALMADFVWCYLRAFVKNVASGVGCGSACDPTAKGNFVDL